MELELRYVPELESEKSHEMGLFTRRSIKKGQKICCFYGPLKKAKNVISLTHSVHVPSYHLGYTDFMVIDSYEAEQFINSVRNDVIVDLTHTKWLLRCGAFMNSDLHTPNVEHRDLSIDHIIKEDIYIDENNFAYYAFYAKRNIDENEELRWAYNI